jgi:2-oxo-hept-3-ene-1,7-dioate hydratase
MSTTLAAALVADIAVRHDTARRTARQFRRITLDHPDMTIDDAYECQRAWVELQVGAGAHIVGHKIGLTSRAMQRTMNIDEPDFGTLLDYMLMPSGVALAAASFCEPQLEVELAFVLGSTLTGTNVGVADVYDATEYVVPALELIDARSFRTDPTDRITRTVRDTIADNAANAGVILGDVRIAPRDIDLRWVAAVFKRNGIVEETGVAAGVLDDPVMGIVWLARRLAGYGVELAAGSTILCGSFTRPVVCRAGDVFEADYHDLGIVTASFN